TGRTESTDFDTVDPIEGDSAESDAFVAKLTPAGNKLAYSTYLGGNGSDGAAAIAVDPTGAAYITGSTESTDFNLANPIDGHSADGDAFVAKLTPAGDKLAYSTYLGGNGADLAFGIAIDATGAAFVTGETTSTDFDRVGAIEEDSLGIDAFVSKLTPTGGALA